MSTLRPYGIMKYNEIVNSPHFLADFSKLWKYTFYILIGIQNSLVPNFR